MKVHLWTWSGAVRAGSMLVTGVVLATFVGVGVGHVRAGGTTASPAGSAIGPARSGTVVADEAIELVSQVSARNRLWSSAYGYRVSVSPRRLSSPGGVVSDSISIRVTGGRSARVRAQLQQTLVLAVQKLEHDFSTDVADHPDRTGPSRQKVAVTQLDSWGRLGSITLTSQESLWGTVNRVHTLLLTQNLRTAEGITVSDLFARPTAADRATRAALVAAGLPRATASHVTFDAVRNSDVPVLASATRKGPRVALVTCSGTCPTVVVPWSHLPATRHGVLPSTR